jgi:hypothetical protein
MTDIAGVDGNRAPLAVVAQRQPSRDFGEELARNRQQSERNDQSDRLTPNGEAPQEGAAQMASSPNDLETALHLALSGAAGAASTICLMQQAVVQPIGDLEAVRDARVFGVHLFAGAYLSEVSTVDGGSNDASSTDRPADAAATAGTPSSATDDTASSATAMSSVEIGNEWGPGATSTLSRPDASLTNPDDARLDSVTNENSYAGTLVQWVDRLLRYSRQSDGGVVAWIRDFRIGADRESQVVAAVLKHASELGVMPQRVMLNGREIWSSSHNVQGERQ